jgi:hypothetical protein
MVEIKRTFRHKYGSRTHWYMYGELYGLRLFPLFSNVRKKVTWSELQSNSELVFPSHINKKRRKSFWPGGSVLETTVILKAKFCHLGAESGKHFAPVISFFFWQRWAYGTKCILHWQDKAYSLCFFIVQLAGNNISFKIFCFVSLWI